MPSLIIVVGLACLLTLFVFLLYGPAFWLPAIDKSRGSKSVEVRRVWEVYDDRLQFMSQRDAFLLNESLDAGDVSQAWLVWSHAAESALVDAYSFSGGPRPCHGFVLGRGAACFSVIMHVCCIGLMQHSREVSG